MRQFLPFDTSHPRCIHPVFGKHFDEVMQASGLDAVAIAKAAGISKEVVRGYRRGFYKPTPKTQAKLEAVFGKSLTPGQTVALAAPEKPMQPVTFTLPPYFKVEQTTVEPETGDMLVTFRLPKENVFEMIAGLALSITAAE